MREILFRGKRMDNGEWVEGLPSYDDDGSITTIETAQPRDGFYFTGIDGHTICQYTGLTDKNGQKIWENDIVTVKHEKYLDVPDTEFSMFPQTKRYERKYAVEFINTGSSYGYRCRNRSIHFLITQNTIFNHEIEVIGNIFDNPELMEGNAE